MMVYAETKECGNSFIQSPRKPPQVPQKEEKRPHPCPLYSLTPAQSKVLPQSIYSLTPAPSPNGEGSRYYY